MRGSPANPAPEHRPIPTTPVKRPAEQVQPQRVSTSPYAKPKVLMGEVTAPKGQIIGAQRDAFRAFMTARHLRPRNGRERRVFRRARSPAFLTGKARSISDASLEKLAAVAKVAPEDMLK